MARKDVDLVIRAKDEAENVVRAITKALNDFNDAQKSTETRSEKTDTALGKLGAAFASLQKAVGTASVGAKIAEEMGRAEKAVARLEGSTAKTRDELARMKDEAAAAEASLAKLTAETAKQSKAQADQTKAVAKSKAELSALRLEINTLEQATKGLVSQQTKLPETISKQEAAIAKTAARLAELNTAYAAAEKPGKTLTNQIASTSTRLEAQSAKLVALKKELSDVGGKLTATGEDMGKLAQKAGAAEAALAKQTGDLAAIKKGYTETSAAARSAAQSQVAAAAAVERLTGRLANEEAQLATASVGLIELGKAAGFSDIELSKLTSGGLSRLQGILAQQKNILAGAKEQFTSLSAAAAELEAQIGRAGVPTRKMSEDFATLKAQVAGSEAILNQARVAFLEMSQSFRTGEKDLNGLEATERQFVAIQGQMSDAIRKATTAYERQVVAVRALHQEQAKGSGSRGPSSLPPVPTAPPVGPWNQLIDAFNRLYGDSRKSLSLTQRLRGEVLSLIAAYGGFYGVVNLLGQVLGAYQKLEAAQARLNVANGGNLDKSAEDMDFLRRTADRLGVDLGTLAQEYSKFSIATLGTNLAGEKTRKIFLSVAEAARVNRSSNEELSGVFVALTQIVSKGAVQMEELRQQLGDRLPGALQIMASGLGVTTAELIKMMAAGEVTSDALVPFAEELDRRFGPGLGDALAGTTVALGRLQNAAFQALVQFGEGGFIDSFTALANKLTALIQSADFGAFIANASAAFSVLIDALGVVVDNFQLFIAVAAGFAGLKLAPLLIGVAAGFGEIAKATKGAIASQIAIRAAMGATGGAAGVAAVGLTGFRAALTALVSSTGVGLIITAIAAGIGYWAASADIATAALENHKTILDAVKNGYDAVGGSVDEWKNKLNSLTQTEAEDNLIQLQNALEDTKRKLFVTDFNDGETFIQQFLGLGAFTGASQDFNRAIDVVLQKFKRGEIDARGLRDGIDEVNQQFDDGTGANHRYAVALVEAAQEVVKLEDATNEASKVVQTFSDDSEEAQGAFDELAGKAGDAAEVIGTEFQSAMDNLLKSVDKLAEMAPKTKTGLDEVAAAADDLQRNYNEALKAARQLPDAIMRAAAEQAALNGLTEGMASAYSAVQGLVDGQFGNFTNGVEAAAALIRDKEDFRATPYYDVNAFRAGFGSDTITLSDGTIQQVVQGMTVSVADANRDLMRRITTEFMPRAAAASGGRFDSFTAQQQAALTSLAYNYGTIPDRVAEVMQSGGTIAEIAEAIRGLGSDGPFRPDGTPVNRQRRIEEAALFESTAGIEGAAEAQVRADEEAAKAAEAKAKALADAAASTQETIADNEFEIQQQTQINAGKEREAAIEAAIRAAKKENSAITDEQLAQIAEQAGRTYDLANAEKEALKPKEAAQKAEESVNNLLAQRTALQEQFNIAKEQGDTAGQDRLKGEIASVNAELITAIENAKSMWAAVGGEEADAAIAKLEATRLAAVHVGEVAKVNYLEWDKLAGLFVDGLAGAFDSFAKQIADGVKPLEALRNSFLQFASDFLLQIAQMIIKQAIFNALQMAFGGTGFGALIGLAHTGGVIGSARAGSGNGSRRVSPGLFAGAPRYHVGGVIGLRPGEVPMIAKKGEEMLTRDDPRHILNGGGSPAVAPRGDDGAAPTIINAWDAVSLMDAMLSDPRGGKKMLNWLRENSGAVSNL